MQELKEGTVMMVANINGKIFTKSFNFKQYDHKLGFPGLYKGFLALLDRETKDAVVRECAKKEAALQSVVKQAEDIANGRGSN